MKSWPTFSRKFTASPSLAASRRGKARAVGPVAEELDQQAGAHARRALRDVRALALAPVGAGDVEVRPGGVAGELAEEGGAGVGAAGAPAGVLHVGHVALDLLVVFFPERQLPHALAAPLAGVLEFPDQRLVVPQHADGVVAQGHDAGAGQRDRKSTRLNSSHLVISYAVFCLKKKKTVNTITQTHARTICIR